MKKKKRGPAEWKRLNIRGINVSIYCWPTSEGIIQFNAYAVILNSRYLTDVALGDPTFRDGDEVGVDTCQKFNDAKPAGEKLMFALNGIEKIIVNAAAVLNCCRNQEL